ncbi:polyamine aminopropyltransferase [Streptomyces qinzhouensis]|uniref:Polyamine aminopropyltransferase n=1 Tax=Streptomyces qinzhouensis TaxID=2599401 RepID=A0A5B8JC34_9ACTN|nr:polyamine aminopropyltransferase [Streptomyces qinzhouensis]QDY78034.1 polyamine aminopropyltransferase [Streptomyces qinzhouensis]
MIDRSPQLSPPPAALPLPVRPDAGRFLVLLGVFVCAACGLVYELELVALASYLIGDSVTQASVVLSLMVFAMGVGSLLAKRLRCRAAVGFGALELALALVGGCSAMALYAAFAWFGESRSVLVAFSLAIGVLIGAEIPLLMSLIQRISRRDAEGTVADLFAADYVGALVGGLAFPFLLLPWLGQLTSGLLTGAVNALVGGGLVLWLFRRDLTRRSRNRLLLANALVLALLATATALVGDFEQAARRAMYGDRVRVAVQTGVQEVVLTGDGSRPPDLFLDGRLRVSGDDEYRYHEALVHPAMNGRHRRVLILGGGDGLAAREVLRHPGAESLTVVELDPWMIRLARTDPGLAALNDHAYEDPRIRVVTADAFAWLRDPGSAVPGGYDVVIADLPDPGSTEGGKFYSQEFYGLVAGILAPEGRLVVHAGPLEGRRRAFWTAEATLRAAGYGTSPYRVGPAGSSAAPGSSGGAPDDRLNEDFEALGAESAPEDWGLLLAAPGRVPRLALGPYPPPLRSLTDAALAADAWDAERTRLTGLPPSTLVHPRYPD